MNAKEMLDTVHNLDLVIVSVLDADHYKMASMVLKRGIHCLLEKPISPDPWECLDLMKLADKNHCHLLICHVLRYTPLYSKLKQILDEQIIGEIQSVAHAEYVSYWHYNHSYVRGNFRNLSPFIMAKSCHDLDLLNWLIGKKCMKISSFGALNYYRKENAPEGSAERCLDCRIEQNCPFSAKKRYLSDEINWPVNMICVDMSLESREKALAEGNYGRCVFYSDNKVTDRQVTNMLYEDGIAVSFNLNGFNSTGFRETRIFGSKGDILANFEENSIKIRSFGEEKVTVIYPKKSESGHGGGDFALLRDVIHCIRMNDWTDMRTGAEQSIDSHIMAFAAEISRESGVIVDIEEYKKEILENGVR